MTTGLFGQQLTLMEELRAATFVAHARLQGVPFFTALAGCQLPIESYVGYLRALSVIHGVLEPALDAGTDGRVASVWHVRLGKRSSLDRDLRFFEPRAVADLTGAVAAAQAVDAHLRIQSLESPLSLLGALYVLEGSTLGAMTLRPMAARAFLLSDNDGLAYLGGNGADTRARWAELGQRMNALTINGDERTQIIKGANDLFGHIESVLRALYPFSLDDRTYSVASINPEAGRHAVPADPREVTASIRAGDRCWQQFPYFEQRYGERGLRFARSDAAWQATLCQFDPDQILQQVLWLGRVLAARGMPTLLLQVQLDMLADELTTAIPSRQTDYDKLRPAAAALHERRLRHLSDADVHTLSAAFDLAAGPDWCARLPHTGTLLASAVADECAGHAAAVTSLYGWMTDAARFPPEWIAAVNDVLANARRSSR